MAEARRRRKKKQQSEYFFDYSLLFIVLFLLGFGLIMIYSASSYEAYDTYGDAAFYMKKQLDANIIGLVGMIIIANIPYHFWERFAMLGYVVSMILIFLVKTWERANSRACRAVSSCLIDWLTADWEIYKFFAAAEMLPVSATSLNTRYNSSFTAIRASSIISGSYRYNQHYKQPPLELQP